MKKKRSKEDELGDRSTTVFTRNEDTILNRYNGGYNFYGREPFYDTYNIVALLVCR